MSHTSRRPYRLLSSVLFVSSLLTISGCGAVKFYPGEERADSEVGRILFNSQGVEMSTVMIDGIPHPHPGRTVEVLPGPHRIEVKYQEETTLAEPVTNGESEGASSGETLVRFGTCNLKFTINAAQELFVFVDAGSQVTVPGSTPPTITLKEQGYYKPALFQERCKEEGRHSVKK
jgi:hypothetical protein